MQLSFKETFQALRIQTRAIERLTHTNAWRRPTRQGGIDDPTLTSECVTPPSKPNGAFTGKKGNVWYTLHFQLIIPALRNLQNRAETSNYIGNISFTHTEVTAFFGAFDQLQGHAEQINEWADRIPEILRNLPETPEDLNSDLKALLDAEISTPAANHLVGRLLQSYYACKFNSYGGFGLPEETSEYLKGGDNLFERNKTYTLSYLKKCPIINEDGTISSQISANQILALYRWFSNQNVVEMVRPNLEGAAAEASIQLSMFLETLYDESKGKVDFRHFDVPPQVLESLQSNEEALARFGRMSALIAGIGEDNQPLLNIIWSPEQIERSGDVMMTQRILSSLRKYDLRLLI